MPEQFALLIAGLCAVVAAHIARDRNAGPWIVLVWQRINRIGQRVARLAAQIRAGTVPPLRAGFKLAHPRAPATRPPLVLSRDIAWLLRAIQQTAVYGAWLRQLLDGPEMPAMLAAAPQLARILRRLCRALGVEPPPLPPRPALRTPAPPEPLAPEPLAPEPRAGEPLAPVATQPDALAAPARRSGPPRPRPARARPSYPWPAPIPAGPAEKPA